MTAGGDAPAVAVIGGGYAGMAAAVELSGRGVPVTVFEAAPLPGGRARRVVVNDTALDNGLHILIGAYSETQHLVERVAPGREHFLRLPLDLHIHNRFRLRAPALPAPLHVAVALLTARGLSLGDKLAAARFMQSMKKRGYRLTHDCTVAALLAEYTQPHDLIEYLWSPLCVAALNTPVARASAQVFLNVLRDSLGAGRKASDLLLARNDLTALFAEPAAAFVRKHGGTIELNALVECISQEEKDFAVQVRGETQYFQQVICAVAPHRATALLADIPGLATARQQIDALQYEAIHSIWLQFDGRVNLPSPMIGLADSPAQWVFDRERICGQRGLVGVVISASEEHVGVSQDALAQRICADLAAQFGPLPPLAWHRVIAEKRATFSCTPDLARPAQITACTNFYLAGDYTAGDYPATIEGAVRSGIACAAAIPGNPGKTPAPSIPVR
ncbi:MAG: hydroxysqualene dehydroxylase HpnE [Betaproteobacteria bacterium]|nr:hydroxysqualene dehydroxylase HpnE [Betaproteobacteria bacterium]